MKTKLLILFLVLSYGASAQVDRKAIDACYQQKSFSCYKELLEQWRSTAPVTPTSELNDTLKAIREIYMTIYGGSSVQDTTYFLSQPQLPNITIGGVPFTVSDTTLFLMPQGEGKLLPLAYNLKFHYELNAFEGRNPAEKYSSPYFAVHPNKIPGKRKQKREQKAFNARRDFIAHYFSGFANPCSSFHLSAALNEVVLGWQKGSRRAERYYLFVNGRWKEKYTIPEDSEFHGKIDYLIRSLDAQNVVRSEN